MRLRSSLAVALGTAALALTAVPAHAALYSHTDAVQDVVVETCPGEDFEDCTSAVDKAKAEGDIVRANIRHQSKRVLIRVKMRELSNKGVRGHFIRIVTNEGIERWVNVLAFHGTLQPQFKELVNRNEDKVRCSGLWAGYDGATDVATFIVPRSCLSYPRWVRVGVGAFTASEDFDAFGADDLMKPNGVSQDTIALSPRIKRG